MSLVDKIVDKTPEEAIRIINEAYAEKQALDLSILSNPDLKAALVGALLGSGAGGIGGAISAAKNRNKVTINDILKGALLGAVPGATAGYMSKSIFNIDPGSEITSGFSKLREKAKELKKSLFEKKEPEETPPPKKFDTNEKMQEEAEKIRKETQKQEISDKYKNLPEGNPSRGKLLGQNPDTADPFTADDLPPNKLGRRGNNMLPPVIKKNNKLVAPPEPIDITKPSKRNPGIDFIGLPY